MNNNGNKVEYGHLMSLYDLFLDRKFIVPDYQRGYSWETEQRKDLMDDILFISKTNNVHYTGTVVATKNRNNIYEIVDGQQRLTSIYILLAVILNKVRPLDRDHEIMIKYIIGEGNDRRLILNRNLDDFLNKILFQNIKPEPEVKSEKNIIMAKEEYVVWLKSNKKDISLIISSICSKLGFLFYTPANDKEIGIMFEVINNRGKPLSELEKLKNYLMYFASKYNLDVINKNINSSWKDILKNLSDCEKTSNDDEDQFLRFCWHVFELTSRNDRYRIYELIKEKYPVGELYDGNQLLKIQQEISDFINILNTSSKYYRDFINSSNPERNKKTGILEQLSCQPSNASIMPLYLSISLSLGDDKYKDIRNELFEILDKLNFRVYVCPEVAKRSDTHQTELYSKAYEFYYKCKSTKSRDVICNDLIGWLKQFVRDKSSMEKIVGGLTLDKNEDYDYYKWAGLGYFLANYEILLNNKKSISISRIISQIREDMKSNDRVDKEHLWGLNNRVYDGNDQWEDYHQKNRLGNFVLLEGGINRECKDLSLEEKMKIYDGKAGKPYRSEFLQIHEIEEIYCKALNNEEILKWSNKTKNYYRVLYTVINDFREERLIRFAIQRWGIDNEKNDYEVTINSFINSNQVYKLINKNICKVSNVDDNE